MGRFFKNITEEEMKELEKIGIHIFSKIEKKHIKITDIPDYHSIYKYNLVLDILLSEEEMKEIFKKNDLKIWFKGDRKDITFIDDFWYGKRKEKFIRKTYKRKMPVYLIRFERFVLHNYLKLNDKFLEFDLVDLISYILEHDDKARIKKFFLDRHMKSNIIKKVILESNI